MPGSFFYNGSCIYISKQHEKLHWTRAERFCRRLPLNATLLTIENEQKLEAIRQELIKLRKKEFPRDLLTFSIGFRYIKSKAFLNNFKRILYNTI